MGWLNKEMEKDRKEIDAHKRKMIEEIKMLDKSKMFVEKPKEKISIFNKYGIAYANWNYKSKEFGIVDKKMKPLQPVIDILTKQIKKCFTQYSI